MASVRENQTQKWKSTETQTIIRLLKYWVVKQLIKGNNNTVDIFRWRKKKEETELFHDDLEVKLLGIDIVFKFALLLLK